MSKLPHKVVGEGVVMGREERPALDLLEQVGQRGVRDGGTVERARAAAELVEDDQ